MNDEQVLVKFTTGEYNVEGLVPRQTTLYNALRAIGARPFVTVRDDSKFKNCKLRIVLGVENLLPVVDTIEATPSFDEEINIDRSRAILLSGSGNVEVMMTEEVANDASVDPNDEIVSRMIKDFESLPIDKKAAVLAGMELKALGDTFSLVMNSPYAAFGKLGELLAGVGIKMDEADHKTRVAAVENEHQPVSESNDTKDDQDSKAAGTQ